MKRDAMALKAVFFLVVSSVLLIVLMQCYYGMDVRQPIIIVLHTETVNGPFDRVGTAHRSRTEPSNSERVYEVTKSHSDTTIGTWHPGSTEPPTRKIVYGTWRERTPNYWSVLNRSYVEEHIQRPLIGNYQCSDVLCSEFLTTDDWKGVDKCLKKVTALTKKEAKTLLPKCHFRNSTSKVLLVSYPGSGNTWVRGLLEKGSGICTGE